jgi:Domain of unknown function (DUF4386)
VNIGRLAGFLYLVVVAGLFSLAYIPSQIVLSCDPQAVARNIMTSERWCRIGIAGLMINHVAFLLLPLALCRLVNDHVRRTWSLTAQAPADQHALRAKRLVNILRKTGLRQRIGN